MPQSTCHARDLHLCCWPLDQSNDATMLFLVVSLSSARHVASWREQIGPKCVWKLLKTRIYIYIICVFESSKFSSSLEALIAAKWRIGAAGPRYLSPAREVRGPDLVLGQGQQTASCLVGHGPPIAKVKGCQGMSRDVKGCLRMFKGTSTNIRGPFSNHPVAEATIPKCRFQVYIWCKPITWLFLRPRRLCILTTCFRGWQYQASGHPHRSEWVMCEVHWSTWIYDHFFGDWLTTYVSGQIPVAFNLYVSIQSMPVLWPLPNAFGNLLLKKRSCSDRWKPLREVEVLLQVPATTNSMLHPLPPVPLHLSASLLLLKASPKT